MHAVFIRAPWVEEVGPAATVLARVERGPAAGRIVAVRQGPLLVTSFHPEVTGDTGCTNCSYRSSATACEAAQQPARVSGRPKR